MPLKKRERPYRIINLEQEYGMKLGNCAYAVASDVPEKELRKQYAKALESVSPFLYLSREMGKAILESQSNTDKHRKRRSCGRGRCSYADGISELYMAEDPEKYQDVGMDPCDILIRREEQEKRAALAESLRHEVKTLTEVQLRRIRMRFESGLTYEEIAEMEDIRKQTAVNSVQQALDKLRRQMSADAEEE